MTSLHDVTDKIKLLGKFTLIICGIFIGLYLLYNIGTMVKEYFYPTPPAPPTASFGKLPPPAFPENLLDSSSFSYTLDTLTGTLPNFPDRATVYKTIPSKPNLLALERAEEKVEGIGFTSKPTRISDIKYVWTISEAPFKKLEMDVLTLNFNLTSNFINDEDILAAKSLLDGEKAKDVVKSLLSSLGNTPKDIDMEKTKTTLLAIHNNSLIEATSLSNTHIIRVDYYQKDINKFPIYYSSYPQTPLNFFVGSTQRGPQVVAANFFHQTIDENTSATYPIKTAEEAFNLLKSGEGYIASSPAKGGNIAIKNITLGYYLGNETTNFLMPIIVFEGDNFYAYISAIKDSWIE